MINLSGETIGMAAGIGLFGLIISFVTKLWLPRRRGGTNAPSPRPLGKLNEAARKAQAAASERREAADDAAIKEIHGRQHTDDAAADLSSRLDGTDDT